MHIQPSTSVTVNAVGFYMWASGTAASGFSWATSSLLAFAGGDIPSAVVSQTGTVTVWLAAIGLLTQVAAGVFRRLDRLDDARLARLEAQLHASQDERAELRVRLNATESRLKASEVDRAELHIQSDAASKGIDQIKSAAEIVAKSIAIDAGQP